MPSIAAPRRLPAAPPDGEAAPRRRLPATSPDPAGAWARSAAVAVAAAAVVAFARDRRGISAVEFALVAPVLILLCLGTVEVGRFALLALKLQHAATTMADLATREEELSAATLDGLFAAARHITAPFDVRGDGVVVVSGVSAQGGAGPTVSWQRRGGDLAAVSEVGAVGEAASLPAELVVDDGETVVAAEVFLRHSPWLLGLVPETTLRRSAFYRPRLGTLRELE